MYRQFNLDKHTLFFQNQNKMDIKYADNVINKTPITFRKKPALNISLTRKRLLPKTIVFGAVATGSINPREADNVAGIMRIRG